MRRSPNPHVGFGGGGPHFCMGTPAREAPSCGRCFGELLTSRARASSSASPNYLVGNFVHAVRSMPYTLSTS